MTETVLTDGYSFTFNNVEYAFKFDEQNKSQENYHGLSHAMKAVDIIVSDKEAFYFIELKDDKCYCSPKKDKDKKEQDSFLNDRISCLICKCRDTFLYRYAQGKVDKPICFIYISTLDDKLNLTINRELERKLPIIGVPETWQKKIVKKCIVTTIDHLKKNFPGWSIQRITNQPIQSS